MQHALRFKQRHKPCQRSWIWPPSPNSQFSQALPPANIFRRCLLCSERCWTTRHSASPWSSCSYDQIPRDHLQIHYKTANYATDLHTPENHQSKKCMSESECACMRVGVPMYHSVPVASCCSVCVAGCLPLHDVKGNVFQPWMLCWHGWREQIRKSNKFSEQVSVPKLVLSTFTSVLRGTICSCCHAWPQNLRGHFNAG